MIVEPGQRQFLRLGDQPNFRTRRSEVVYLQ
jgi:hypothetical protein